MKSFPALCFVLSLLSGSLFPEGTLEKLLAMDAKKKEKYAFNPASTLPSRLALAPGFVYDYLTNLDQDPGYRAYLPVGEERQIVERTLARLPPLNQRVLKERLLGMYFIEGFQGSGMADFVLDARSNFYFIIVLNRAVLGRNLSEQFTYRESTCFRQGNDGTTVRVDCGTNERGLLYILLHESTHAVDYVRRINPFVEESLRPYLREIPKSTAFSRGLWEGLETPIAPARYTGRDRVTFYGFNQGPKLAAAEAPDLYRALTNSGFVSLYASQNWAEELAELVTLRAMTERLRLPYRILVERGGKTVEVFEPAASPKALERFKAVDAFFN
ncbi:MAG: hypothetical protein J0L75_03505 [Spirochaetes bacterium]|nr:hypothetical protein [Spirochaetota bacterium]